MYAISLQTNLRDSTPEPVITKTKKNKSKDRRERKRTATQEEEDLNDEDFVVASSKSKAHAKIKVDPKTASVEANLHSPRCVSWPHILHSDTFL